MDPKEYRGQLEEQVRQAHQAAPAEPVSDLKQRALDRAADPEQRAAAFGRLHNAILEDDELLSFTVAAIADANEAPVVRLAALGLMQLVSVTMPKIKLRRPEYFSALRKAIHNTADRELQWRVLGVLARENDRDTQDMLIQGLRDPSKAVVSVEKAVQLLGYDMKTATEICPLLQEIARNNPSVDARVEALRLLAVDPGSRDLIVQLARDRGEEEEVRQAALAALHSLDPAAMRVVARELVLDQAESPDLQAASIMALSLGDGSSDDEELARYIETLGRETASDMMRQSAGQYLSKRERKG